MAHLCTYKPDDSIPAAHDMIDLHSTIDRFEHNVIDPNVELRRGDRAFLAGFYGEKAPYDCVAFLSRTPKIVVGRVLTASRGPGAGLVSIEVPRRDYRGMSGGPAAIVDEHGIVRVWGVVIQGGLVWDSQDLVFRHIELVARIPADRLSQYRRTKLLHPNEPGWRGPLEPNVVHHSWRIDSIPEGD